MHNITSPSSNPPFIEGPAGQLEVIIEHPAQQVIKAMAVCCHPHPLHGGAMTNKVVHTLARACVNAGLPALRFNFRGVGKSEGSYAEGQGEQQDLRSVVAWVREHYPEHHLLLAGFSFGAYVSTMCAASLNADGLISVAPPLKRFDFSSFVEPHCPWLVIQGDADEVVDAHAVWRWLAECSSRPVDVRMEGAGHFFHGRLVELRGIVETFISDHAGVLHGAG